MPMFENASYFNASGQFNEVHGNQTIVTSPAAPTVESARTFQSPPDPVSQIYLTMKYYCLSLFIAAGVSYEWSFLLTSKLDLRDSFGIETRRA